jgi:putative glycerol-1-phosphate prenyltransferase
MSVFDKLLQTKDQKGAGYWVLLDPDKQPEDRLPAFLEKAQKACVDSILVGGSLLLNSDLDEFVHTVKQYCGEIPVILFPGSVHQISKKADALLFLSLISGRDAQQIVGSQVLAAPIIHKNNLEAISTAYMIIDSGQPTSAQFMSGTIPLPRNKPEIVVAHALAAQYMGFKFIYLEGGSGAEMSVPVEIIRAVTQTIDIPVIVGGGIRTPQEAAEKVQAGASFIVTGNVLEKSNDSNLLHSLSQAIHSR